MLYKLNSFDKSISVRSLNLAQNLLVIRNSMHLMTLLSHNEMPLNFEYINSKFGDIQPLFMVFIMIESKKILFFELH